MSILSEISKYSVAFPKDNFEVDPCVISSNRKSRLIAYLKTYNEISAADRGFSLPPDIVYADEKIRFRWRTSSLEDFHKNERSIDPKFLKYIEEKMERE